VAVLPSKPDLLLTALSAWPMVLPSAKIAFANQRMAFAQMIFAP
jgi:hypothetical protein